MQFSLVDDLPRRAALRHRNSISYITVRSWPHRHRRQAIEFFKAEKLQKSGDILQLAATEIANEIRNLAGEPKGWVVTAVACGHSRDRQCWGKLLARSTAAQMKLPFKQVFLDRLVRGSSHQRQFERLPALKLSRRPTSPVMIIDDVATSGWHLEEAALAIRSHGLATVQVAWISGTIKDRVPKVHFPERSVVEIKPAGGWHQSEFRHHAAG